MPTVLSLLALLLYLFLAMPPVPSPPTSTPAQPSPVAAPRYVRPSVHLLCSIYVPSGDWLAFFATFVLQDLMLVRYVLSTYRNQYSYPYLSTSSVIFGSSSVPPSSSRAGTCDVLRVRARSVSVVPLGVVIYPMHPEPRLCACICEPSAGYAGGEKVKG